MRCPYCDADKESLKVIDSRTCEGGRSIRRRRECLKCSKRFTTYERIEQPNRLMVIKRNGERVPFDRAKILGGLEHACYKRPVSDEQKSRIVESVEDEVHTSFDREVPSTFIGQAVVDRLRRVDQVAYVRFASVYKKFKTLEDLVDEAKLVIDARRFEDPEQGTLFVEPAKPTNGDAHGPGSTNGAPAPANSRRGRKPKASAPPRNPAE
jgi:transcriptional repressor NrdR